MTSGHGWLQMPKSLQPDRKQALQRGSAAEARALDYLQQQGLSLIEQNFSCRWGEIDLIMREVQTLVFVEVRQRSSKLFGGAAASVGAGKQARMWHTAEYYLQSKGLAAGRMPPCRFDLIAIDGEQLSWIKDIISH
jgi:putative endonuclease